MSDDLDLSALVTDPGIRVVVCCGAGGVGKTTTAAALALHAAEAGRRTVVLTIDPARRLAQSLGVAELGNEPARVPGVDGTAGGSLDAMMLDMKRTFDETVLAHATPERAAAILANPVYAVVSSSFAGTQEYMAMEKLGQLRDRDAWDLVVVDTPPSRSALDFLDAPRRLGGFLDSRFLRLLLAPARAGGRTYLRALGVGVGAVSAVLDRVVGASLLRDLQSFLGALDAVFGGFRQRAEETYEQLTEPGTAFLVVAIPEPDALREAAYFAQRLGADEIPLAGLVINRVHRPRLATLDRERADAAATAVAPAAPLVAGVLRVHAELAALAERDALARRDFAAAHPAVAIAEVPTQPVDVHDLAGLRRLGAALAGPSNAKDGVVRPSSGHPVSSDSS